MNQDKEQRPPADESIQAATRLLGFALFNLNKGNPVAAMKLMRKAYLALTGKPWDAVK